MKASRLLFVTVAVLCVVSPAGASTPDPTLLPIATTSQTPNTAAYNALNVPSLAAGSYYLDPLTGVKVYKLTSASFPASGYSFTHDYAEGGDEVSLPLDASGKRTIHVYTGDGNQWLIDFTPGAGVSNPRNLSTSAFPPFINLCTTFSNNPATPYYIYISTGSAIHRVDFRTMTEVPGGGWPVTGETEAMWLHQSENDAFFTWMRGANGPTIVGYEPATGTKKTITNSGVNEPRIDRDGSNRFVCLSMTTPQNQALFWDWRNNVIAWSSPVQSYGGDPPVAHQASLRGYWVGVQWDWSYPWPFYKISSTPNSIVEPLPGGSAQGGGHCDGNWIQHPANTDDQWFACYYYGALAPPPSNGALGPGGILLSTANGQRRILAHLYNTSTNYTYYSFAKLAPDGAYVLFTSDMDGSSRSDLFLAEIPTGSSTTPPPDTTPPTVSISSPAAGSPVSGSILVTANATDNVGVAGVQFLLDGTALGAEDISAPYSVTWNTTTSTNGTHLLSATARDAAGNRSTSASVSVTVSNATPDTTPPTVPTGLTATAISASQINLSWTASTDTQSGVAGYKIFRGGSQIATSATTSYSDSGLTASTAYSYTVAAYDVAGNTSTQSGPASATTLAPPPPPTTGGNIVLLHLDENASATLFVDSSGSSNNGTCSGTACPASGITGKVGRAASFNGTSNFITITHNSGLDAYPLTVSAWFKTTSASGVVGLVNKYVGGSYNGYNIFLNNGHLCAWYLRDTSNYVYDNTGCPFNIGGFNDNAWHQVVYVVDASGGKLYVDAALKGSLSWTGAAGAPTTTQDIHIAHYPGAFGGIEYFTGSLDEIRIDNIALSATAITSQYNSDNADTIAPAVSLTAPSAGATVSGPVTVTATASDNAGVAGVQFMLDGAALGAEDTTSPYSIAWDTTTATNGSHMLTAVARDAAGNRTTSVAITVTVSNSVPDTTAPRVAINSPAAGATVSGVTTVSATASDNVGVAGVQFLLDGAALGSEVTIAPYSVSWDTTHSANGSHTLTAVARDAAGNRTTSAAVTVTVSNVTPDTTPPTVPAGLTATAVSTSQINLSWTASADSQSGIGGYKIFRNSVPIATTAATSYSDSGLTASTTYSYAVAAYDIAGNNSAQSASASATTLTPPPPPPAGGNIVLLHLDEAAGATTFVDASGSSNNGTCSGTSCPTAGVAGKVGNAATFDGTGDFISIASRTGLNAYPLTVSAWFKTGSTSGVVGLVDKYVGGSYNGYDVFMNNGHLCAWYLRDASNYVYDGSGCPFNIGGFNDNAWHQVVYVVDATGGKLYVDASLKGSLSWTGTAGAPTTTQDIHIGHYPGAFGGVEYFNGTLDEIRIYNSALSASDIGAQYTADNTTAPATPPPAPASVTITTPSSGATLNGSVQVSADVTDSVAIAGVQFYIDGLLLGAESTAPPFAVSWNTSATSNGSHMLSAVARDIGGNQVTSAAVQVNVANNAPSLTVTVTSPASGATVSGKVPIAASAWSSAVGVRFYVDGTQIGMEDVSAPFAVTWDTTLNGNGTHALTAVARDLQGNIVTSAAVSVNVSNGGVRKRVGPR